MSERKMPSPMAYANHPPGELGRATMLADVRWANLIKERANEYGDYGAETECYELLSQSLQEIVRLAGESGIDLGRPPDGEEYARVIYHLAAGDVVERAWEFERNQVREDLEDVELERLDTFGLWMNVKPQKIGAG